MAKVTALAPIVAQVYGYDVSITGWGVAVFFILGFALAVPGAKVVQKLGVRWTVSISIALGAIGSLLGVIGSGFTIFLISRIFEGAAFGVMGVAGPSAIAPWFPKKKRGFPLGLWATWVALAMFACPILYGEISAINGITNPFDPAALAAEQLTVAQIWWGTFIFDVVILVVFNLLYRDAPRNMFGEDEDSEPDTKIDWKGIFTNPVLISLALIFLVDELAFMAINGLFTTYLTGDVGSPIALDMATATLWAGAAAFLGFCFAPIFGKLTDVLKTQKWVLLFGLIGGIGFTALVFTQANINLYYLIVVLGGIAGGGVPSVIWGSVPATVKPDQIPSANAMVAFSQNIGMFIGAIAMGNAVLNLGWTTASFVVLVPAYVICIIILFVGLRKLK
jgi:MFS family permease